MRVAVYHALCSLQAALGVQADGQVGPETLRALESQGMVVGGRHRQPSSSWDPDPLREFTLALCDCTCGTPCPQGKTGSEGRCRIWTKTTPEGK